MVERKLYKTLKNHLNEKQILVITGLRRVGKSTLLKRLLTESPTKNKLYFDLERIENQRIFNQDSYLEIERTIELMGFDFSQPGVIAIDEIQMVKNIPSILKVLYDDYGTKFIVTGSSSFYLRNHFSESLAGRKNIFELNPLDFEEFLWFKNIETQRIQKEKMQPFLDMYFTQFNALYEEFIQFGGFPEVVLATSNEAKERYLMDILNSHIDLDVRLLGDISFSDLLYQLIRLLANRVGSKIDYTKIGSLTGIPRAKVKEYILLLEHTYLIKRIPPFVNGIDKEITKANKLYFTDTGLLRICGQNSSGALFENVIAQQLSLKGELAYYEKTTGTEIDFILNKEIAFEVKETPTSSDQQTLKRRATPLNLKEMQLIGRRKPLSGYKYFLWGGNIF